MYGFADARPTTIVMAGEGDAGEQISRQAIKKGRQPLRRRKKRGRTAFFEKCGLTPFDRVKLKCASTPFF
jgi:hypothetical protein